MLTRDKNDRSKHRAVPHSMVLPPGEFNSTILHSFTVCSESFMTVAATVSRTVATATTIVTS